MRPRVMPMPKVSSPCAALERLEPEAACDAKGYVVDLERNLLHGIARADIEADFGGECRQRA